MYLFFANPMTSTVSYPMEYANAFNDKGSLRKVTINHHGRSDIVDLKFNPIESVLIEATSKGVRQIPLDYIPQRLPE